MKRSARARAATNTVRFTGYALADDRFVKASVLLSRLERAQSRRPASFVRILHQLTDELRGAVALDQCALDDGLQYCVRSGYHPSPASDTRRGQC